jgi:hypothetical protein
MVNCLTTTFDDLAARLSIMLDELDASDRIRVYESTRMALPPESATVDAIAKDLQEYVHVSLAPPLRRCFMPFARFGVHWECVQVGKRKLREPVGGEIALTYLYHVASSETDVGSPRTPAKERALLRSLRVIDDQPAGGNGTFAAIRLVDAQLTPDVWFFDVRSGLHSLDVDYCGYLEALTVTRGWYGWQYLFADIDLSKPEQRMLLARLRRMVELLPLIFPKTEISSLAERLAARTARGTQ